MHISSRILKFGLAGIVGFVVDSSLVTGLVWTGLDPVVARCFSIAAAILATWLVNRSLAFADRAPGPPTVAEFLRYAGASFAALLVNFGLFWLLVRWQGIFAQWPVLAVALATGVSMCVNFLSYFKLVFAHRE